MSEINNFLGQKNLERKVRAHSNYYLNMLQLNQDCDVAQQNLDAALNDNFKLMNKNTIAEAEKIFLEFKEAMKQRAIFLQRCNLQEISMTCVECSHIELCYPNSDIEDKSIFDESFLGKLKCTHFKEV